MKKDNDIFTLFQASQHKLDEVPGRHAWTKLESKLDAHRARHRSVLYRQLAMAATLLALVAFISLLSILLMPEQANTTASADTISFETVDLATSQTSGTWSKAVFIRSEYETLAFDEGEKGKKLQVLSVRNQPKPNRPAPVPATPPSLIAEDTKAGPAVEMSEKETILNSSKNVLEYYTVDQLDPSVRKFQWLLGQWVSEIPEEDSFEEWQIEDAFTLSGQGYLVINGEKQFVDKMEIRKIDEDLYFITSLDAGGKEKYFKLKSVSNKKAVFASETESFPTQIILQQTAKDQFTTILENDASSNMSSSQVDFLQQRNAINKERAVRNLRRIN